MMRLSIRYVACLSLLMLAQAAAACEPPASGAPKCKGVGNPIDVVKGNKFQQDTDLPALPGQMGLELVRYYNSSLSSVKHRTGLLGRGWRLSYETSLAVIGNTVQIVEADGNRLIFSRDPLNPSLCSSIDPAQGAIDIRSGRAGDEFIWRKPDGRRLTFDKRGLLVQVLAPNGDFLSMQHDARGWLVKVTDPQGRVLRLSYLEQKDASGGTRFRGVQSIETPVGSFRYQYGSPPPAGTSPADAPQLVANLSSVTMPGGEVRQYHYEDARFPTLLTGISLSGRGGGGKAVMRRYATYAYDSNAKAVLSTHAGNADRITLDTSEPGKTILTNSIGQKTVYHYSLIAGDLRLTEVRGPGCSLCGPVNVKYGYDKFGRVTKLTSLASSGQPLQAVLTEYDYYGRPRIVSRTLFHDGKEGKPEWQVRYHYAEGAGLQPIFIVRPSVVPGHARTIRVEYGTTEATAASPTRIVEAGFVPGLDGQGAVSQIQRTIKYAYDAKGRRIRISSPSGSGDDSATGGSQIDYASDDGLLTRTIAEDGTRTEVLARDAALRPTRIRMSDGVTVRMAEIRYHWRGQPEGLSLSASWASGPAGTLQRNAKFSYNAQGLLETISGPNGTETRFIYDEAGRLLRRQLADGSVAETLQDSEGRIREIARYATAIDSHDAALSRISYDYDEANRPIQVSDTLGPVQRMEYNDGGEILSLANAAGIVTGFAYDREGLLSKREIAFGTESAATVRYGYDRHAQMTALTDANGVRTERRYDDFGRLVFEHSPDSGSTLYLHDAAGRVTARTDSSGVTAYYRYDAAGRIVSSGTSARPGSVTYSYRGRWLHETIVRGEGAGSAPIERIQYEYNPFGQRVIERKWIARLDEISQPMRKVAVAGGLTFLTRFDYDSAGRLTRQVMPDGHSVTYRYSAPGLPTAIFFDDEPVVADIRQSFAAGLLGYTYGNGIRLSLQNDARGRLTAIEASRSAIRPAEGHVARWLRSARVWFGTGQQQEDLVYRQRNRYDAMDRLIGLEREAGQRRHGTFAYDTQGRLAILEEMGGVRRFSYDAGGNRLSERSSSVDQEVEKQYRYQAGTNRLEAILNGQKQVEHMFAFHKTGIPLLELNSRSPQRGFVQRRTVYNAARRPVSIYEGNELVATYRYNLSGERIAKTVRSPGSSAAPVTTYYLYQSSRLVAEADASGRLTSHYLYFNGKPVAKVDVSTPPSAIRALWQGVRNLFSPVELDTRSGPAKLYFLHTDHLGLPQLATDAMQSVVWRGESDAFGQMTRQWSPSGLRIDLRLPGQLFDAETGTHYNYYRDYDPSTGRYTTVDPLGIDGGFNPFTYTANNPLTATDGLGLYQQDVHYYMTFFLAVCAGLGADEARVIATAAQYVDDNDLTKPLEDKKGTWELMKSAFQNAQQLKYYHFTLSSSTDGITLDDYNNKNFDIVGRESPQLDALRTASQSSMQLISADYKDNRDCIELILFGEYLHAFEDTFSHRNFLNYPINAILPTPGEKQFGIGHAYYGSFPDYTHNSSPLWSVNEERTLKMEERVWEKLKDLGGTGKGAEWKDIEPLLRAFNAIEEHETHGVPVTYKTFSKKREALAAALEKLGLDPLIDPYVPLDGKRTREDFLCKISNPNDPIYSNVLLPSAADCKKNES